MCLYIFNMRIGIVADAVDLQYAGIHYFTRHLITELIRAGTDHRVILIRPKPGSDEFNCAEIVIPMPGNFVGNVLRHLKAIPKAAVGAKVDVLIEPAHFGPFNLPPEIKRVTIIHDLTPVLFPAWHPKYSVIGHYLFLRKILRRTDLIIANSSCTKEDIVKRFKIPREKIVPVHLGVSEHFRPVDDPVALGKYGIYKPYFLYQGTIEPRKNIVNLIAAYEIYRRREKASNIQLILSGKKGWRIKNVIKARFNSAFKDDIILLGYVDREDMPALYSGAAGFIYPSLYEGFGMPVLEAMACGIPVATSNTSSLPEVGGRFTIQFDPRNPGQIADAFIMFKDIGKDHLKKQMEYAHRKTWKSMAEEILGRLNTMV